MIESEKLFKAGKREEAKRVANEEINSNINVQRNYIILGKYHVDKDDYESGVLCFKESYEGGEDRKYKEEASYYMVICYIQLKKYAEAYRIYNKRLQTSGYIYHAFIHNQISYCLFQMRKFHQGVYEAEFAMTYDEERRKRKGIQEKDDLCRLYKLCNLNEDERYYEALYHIDKEMKDELNNDTAVVEQYCFAQWGKKEYDKCIEKCKEYLDKDKDLNYYLSLCSFSKKEYPQALEYINKCVDDDTVISYKKYFLKGQILKALKNDKDAFYMFTKSYENNPKHLEAYIEIAKLYKDHNLPDKAEQILLKGNSYIDEEYEKKNELLYHLVRAEMYYRNNKMKEGNELVNFVRDYLNELNTMDSDGQFTKQKMLDILFKYFELHSVSKGYTINDLIFKKDEDSLIGHGGFGEVYCGTLKGKDVAIKNFKMKVSEDLPFDKLYSNMTAVFFELSNMEIFNHENILDICTIMFREGTELYLITPLCKGGSLSYVLRGETEMSIKPRIKIAIQLAEALKYMHTKFNPYYIHHDIKSSNVLLVDPYDDKKENKIKLCDFGGARTPSTFHCTYTSGWAAPEVYYGNNCNYKLDIYSYGVTLWEIFARDVPFENMGDKEEIERTVKMGGRPDINKVGDIPEEIKELIQRCWKDDKDERPDEDEIIRILKSCL
ncbi:MAG: protein kinase [archaeon]|nr:protein kinase [archaeon]